MPYMLGKLRPSAFRICKVENQSCSSWRDISLFVRSSNFLPLMKVNFQIFILKKLCLLSDLLETCVIFTSNTSFEEYCLFQYFDQVDD